MRAGEPPGETRSPGTDLQKVDQVRIDPNRDAVVVRNLTRMPQANLADKPPQMGDATKENFGAAENMLFVSCDTLQVGECRKDTDVQKRSLANAATERFVGSSSGTAAEPKHPTHLTTPLDQVFRHTAYTYLTGERPMQTR